jgi:hypothetical protein
LIVPDAGHADQAAGYPQPMTFGGPATNPAALGTGSVLDWPRARWPRIILLVAVLLAAGVGVASAMATSHRHGTYHPGDCVVVAPSTGGELHATGAACDTDPSFTVAKLADRTGGCAPDGSNAYDRFAPPFADAGTGRLCLVPNLVAGHCYRLGAAVGVWNLVDCVGAETATIKVTKRLDADDARACVPESRLPARTYPAPPRTYCLGLAT